jgi:hypothetical protein
LHKDRYLDILKDGSRRAQRKEGVVRGRRGIQCRGPNEFKGVVQSL